MSFLKKSLFNEVSTVESFSRKKKEEEKKNEDHGDLKRHQRRWKIYYKMTSNGNFFQFCNYWEIFFPKVLKILIEFQAVKNC